ncbi:uncharacterized protein BJX67DRAFT_77221 [Aspergillus lucknowensis]|uniref:Major facilitator superfamily (MFS) profile domain-containing protein n=1 Tax=Aspergillus lucknowensis TaxID=176173 RepID=A0ABR4LT92_9EURO
MTPVSWRWLSIPWKPRYGLQIYDVLGLPRGTLFTLTFSVSSHCIKEFFGPNLRSLAQAATTASNWLFNFLVSCFTKQMFAKMNDGVCFFFAALSFCAFFIAFFLVPETSGKPLESVDRLFKIKPVWKAHEKLQVQLMEDEEQLRFEIKEGVFGKEGNEPSAMLTWRILLPENRPSATHFDSTLGANSVISIQMDSTRCTQVVEREDKLFPIDISLDGRIGISTRGQQETNKSGRLQICKIKHIVTSGSDVRQIARLLQRESRIGFFKDKHPG